MKIWRVSVVADKKEKAEKIVKGLVRMSNAELNEKLIYHGLIDYIGLRKIDKIVHLMDEEIMNDLSYEEIVAYDGLDKVDIEICV